MSQIIFEDTCDLIQVSSGKTLNVVVHEFKEKQSMTVIVQKSVKLPMKWNGRIYEGKMAGLDFTSVGPKVNKINKSIRG